MSKDNNQRSSRVVFILVFVIILITPVNYLDRRRGSFFRINVSCPNLILIPTPPEKKESILSLFMYALNFFLVLWVVSILGHRQYKSI